MAVKKCMLVLAVVAVACLAVGLYAQDEKPKTPRMPSAFGKVVKLDKEAKTLVINGKMKRDDEAKDLTFDITDETKVTIAGETRGESKPGTLDDVKADVNVFIMYKAAEGEGKNPVALTIRIGGAMGKKKAG